MSGREIVVFSVEVAGCGGRSRRFLGWS